MLIAYTIRNGVLVYIRMYDYHNNFSMHDNILFFVSVSYIVYDHNFFFVECKFKARISAYSLYHSKWFTVI